MAGLDNTLHEGMEIELKLLLLSPLNPEEFWQHPAVAKGLKGAPVTKKLLSTYYDTTDHRLLQNGITYRIRKDGNHWISTVKSMGGVSAGLHSRDEWNDELPAAHPRPDLITDESVRHRVLSLLEDHKLQPILATRFQRMQADWDSGVGHQIEIALDMGEIVTSARDLPIREIELELKKGTASSLVSLGTSIAVHFPTILGHESKFFRGLQALQMEGQIDSMPIMPGKEHTKTSDEKTLLSIQTPLVLNEAYDQLVDAYLQLHRDPDNPERVHQIRVQVRRFRSLLAFFKPALVPRLYQRMQHWLQTLGQETAEVRELDVMQEHYALFSETYMETRKPEETDPLWVLLVNKRQQARDKLMNKIRSGALTPIVLQIGCLVRQEVVMSAEKDPFFRVFCEKRMKKWMNQLHKLVNEVEPEKIEQVHRLRIRGKRIRYVLEHMGPVIPRLSEKFLKRMKQVQDLLGQMNDIQCELDRMKAWMDEQDSNPLAMRWLGRYTGWQQQRLINRQSVMTKKMKKVIKEK